MTRKVKNLAKVYEQYTNPTPLETAVVVPQRGKGRFVIARRGTEVFALQLGMGSKETAEQLNAAARAGTPVTCSHMECDGCHCVAMVVWPDGSAVFCGDHLERIRPHINDGLLFRKKEKKA